MEGWQNNDDHLALSHRIRAVAVLSAPWLGLFFGCDHKNQGLEFEQVWHDYYKLLLKWRRFRL